MLRLVALVRTDVSEELCVSFIRVTRIGELGTTLAVTSNRRTQSVLTRATRRNIPEDGILHSRREKAQIFHTEIFVFLSCNARYIEMANYILASASSAALSGLNG
jgi:hypothetical protein